jgi:hypothetical protein
LILFIDMPPYLKYTEPPSVFIYYGGVLMDRYEGADLTVSDEEWSRFMEMVGFGTEPALEGEEFDETQGAGDELG